MTLPLEIWSAIIGSAAATIFTILVGVGGYFYRRWEQKCRAYKQLLYNQLAIWDVVATIHYSDTEAFVEFINAEMMRRAPSYIEEEYLSAMIPSILRPIHERLVSFVVEHKRSDKLSERYGQALQEVSKTDPFLAFKLEGQDNTQAFLSKVDNSLSEYTNQVVGDLPLEEEENHFKALMNEVDSIIGQDKMETFEDQILTVAAEAGIRSETQELIERVKRKRSLRLDVEQMEQIANDMPFEEVFKLFEQQMKPEESKNGSQ